MDLIVAKLQAMTWVQMVVVGQGAIVIALLILLDRRVQHLRRKRRGWDDE